MKYFWKKPINDETKVKDIFNLFNKSSILMQFDPNSLVKDLPHDLIKPNGNIRSFTITDRQLFYDLDFDIDSGCAKIKLMSNDIFYDADVISSDTIVDYTIHSDKFCDDSFHEGCIQLMSMGNNFAVYLIDDRYIEIKTSEASEVYQHGHMTINVEEFLICTKNKFIVDINTKLCETCNKIKIHKYTNKYDKDILCDCI